MLQGQPLGHARWDRGRGRDEQGRGGWKVAGDTGRCNAVHASDLPLTSVGLLWPLDSFGLRGLAA